MFLHQLEDRKHAQRTLVSLLKSFTEKKPHLQVEEIDEQRQAAGKKLIAELLSTLKLQTLLQDP